MAPAAFCWQHQAAANRGQEEELLASNHDQLPQENNAEYFQVLLEEYKSLSQGIYQRIDLQQKLLNFQLLFLAILVALIAKNLNP